MVFFEGETLAPSQAGTDGALAMGFLNILISEDLYDRQVRREMDERLLF